ncbi:MAG TPA: hypothetical protein PKY87_11190 [Terricaulis sp.]|nr:hypothetical protein [Terricaulis sp.]
MQFARFSLVAAAFAALVLAAPASEARDPPPVPTNHPIAAVIEHPDFAAHTQGVTFYFGNQRAPAVAQRIEQNVTTRRPARSRRDAEEACQAALLNSLIALRNYALTHGGNAVVNIRSNTNLIEFSSTSEYQCVRSGRRVTAALKGDIVRLR